MRRVNDSINQKEEIPSKPFSMPDNSNDNIIDISDGNSSNNISKLHNMLKIDTDEERDLAIKYGIMSIPTFIVFKNGEVKAKSIGMQDKEELIEMINK